MTLPLVDEEHEKEMRRILIESAIEKRQYELQNDLLRDDDFVEILSDDINTILYGEP